MEPLRNWLLACWYDLKESWCRFWIADEETSRLLDLMDQEQDLREETRRVLNQKRLRP